MDKILVYRQEVDRLLVYIQGFLGRSVGLEEVRGGGLLRLDDRVVACLLEENRLPFKKLVHEVHRRLEVKVLKDGSLFVRSRARCFVLGRGACMVSRRWRRVCWTMNAKLAIGVGRCGFFFT